MQVTLYQYWRSSCSWRIRWALSIKQIPFQSVMLDLFEGEQRTAEHRARNPMGQVPSIEINGRFLSESVAILEHLEETIPSPPLYPSDPWERARVRQLIEIINAGVQPLHNLSVLDHISNTVAERKRWGTIFIERGLLAYEALVAIIAREQGRKGPFSIGHTLTAADLFLVPEAYTARHFGVEMNKFPRLIEIEKAALATEHAACTHPNSQPIRSGAH